MTTSAGNITSQYYFYPQPNICPGCGKCRTCGQPNYPTQPFQPYWGQPQWVPSYPIYMNDNNLPSDTPTCGGTHG